MIEYFVAKISIFNYKLCILYTKVRLLFLKRIIFIHIRISFAQTSWKKITKIVGNKKDLSDPKL